MKPRALIGFADALKKVYGAVIYQQTGTKSGVAAKSRVAPIKHPLTELMCKVMTALN